MQVGAEHLGMLSKQIYNVLSLYVPDGTVYLTASSAMLIHVSIRSICMFCRSTCNSGGQFVLDFFDKVLFNSIISLNSSIKYHRPSTFLKCVLTVQITLIDCLKELRKN